MNLNQDFIRMPLIFATNAANRAYCDQSKNYIFLWESKVDGNPVYLIKDQSTMEHQLILRMQNKFDFQTDSIENDVMNQVNQIFNES